jgi:hypothetical protein
MDREVSFPIYRKYAHDRTFFKILSKKTFVQLDIVGEAFMIHTFKAKIHPDRILVIDMIEMADGAWIASSEEEFESKLAYCRKNLKEIG